MSNKVCILTLIPIGNRELLRRAVTDRAAVMSQIDLTYQNVYFMDSKFSVGPGNNLGQVL